MFYLPINAILVSCFDECKNLHASYLTQVQYAVDLLKFFLVVNLKIVIYDYSK